VIEIYGIFVLGNNGVLVPLVGMMPYDRVITPGFCVLLPFE